MDRKTLNLKGCSVTIFPAEFTEITAKEDSFSNMGAYPAGTKLQQAKALASHKLELKFKASFHDFSTIKEEYIWNMDVLKRVKADPRETLFFEHLLIRKDPENIKKRDAIRKKY